MFKNVSGQKAVLFAFDSTTNLPQAGDAANLTAYVSKDYATAAVLTDTSASEMDSTNAKGYYLFDLAQSETNADVLLFSGKSSTSNIVVIGVPAIVFTVPAYTAAWDGIEIESESGLNAREIMSLMAAVLLGRTSGLVAGAAGAPQFKNAGGSTNRITGTVDADGNRTSITLIPPI